MNPPLKVVVEVKDLGFISAYVPDWLDLEAAAEAAREMDTEAAETLENDVLSTQ